MQWNSEKTLALVKSHEADPIYGMPTAYWYGSPEHVTEECDMIAGFMVAGKQDADHGGKPAVRLTLADENGNRNVGRLVLALDCLHDGGLEFTRFYPTTTEMNEDIEILISGGYVRRPARTLMVGDEVRTTRDDAEAGTVTGIELVPGEVRGGDMGLAVDLDTLTGTFLDMDLDEEVLVKVR